MVEGIRFSGLRFLSLLLANNVVLLVSINKDLQLILHILAIVKKWV